jgi:riboflavin kinase/FMN adenylyltransferase
VTSELGRFTGTVVHGDGRGKGLGFPTANLDTPVSGCVNGVYAGWVRIDGSGRWRQATISVGDNPTFENVGASRVECYIHDFNADLYGARIDTVLVSFIRDMRAFGDVDALVARATEDVATSRRILMSSSAPGRRRERSGSRISRSS